jgi:uncharacterized repeat protein (TIGR03803 family)
MKIRHPSTSRCIVWFEIIFCLVMFASIGRSATTLTTLVTFNGTNGFLWSSPSPPDLDYSLTLGPDGLFYGTTVLGGPSVDDPLGPPLDTLGTIFKVGLDGGFTTVLALDTNTFHASTSLLLASDGNLYGAAPGGGLGKGGVIFRVTPAGALTNVFSFSGIDGRGPNELMQARDGALYGTTAFSSLGYGTVFNRVGVKL